MNYTELIAAIKTTSGRTDAVTIAAIPQFVAMAQTTLDSRLKIALLRRDEAFPASGVTLTLTSVRRVETIQINGVEGRLVDLAALLAVRGSASQSVAAPMSYPAWFAMNAGKIELIQPAEVGVSGYSVPPRLSTTAPENDYTTGAPNALLYLSLSSLSTFTRDSEAAASWMALATDEIDALNAAHEESNYVGEVARKNETYF
ncbi:phage adaptor protein [Buttiauxella brennerae]|uniref:phage adaptor protein n=1 Tax=Buttiauxella brennerae TaxID=82988 RepID=UPI00286EDF93|nr:hypothetical protein [Buttiauxella brennerae]